MKALLIDPTKRAIEQINLKKGLQEKYKIMECSLIECPIQLKNGDILFCDEEGKLKGNNTQGGFSFIDDWDDIIVGKCLIVGVGQDGMDADCKSTPEYFINHWNGFSWFNAAQVKTFVKMRYGF